jgi:hypothetical protein
MTDQPPGTAARTRIQVDAAHQKILLRLDVGMRWDKFSTREIIDLKDDDDLVTRLVAKYGLQKEAATRDAEAVVRGRIF